MHLSPLQMGLSELSRNLRSGSLDLFEYIEYILSRVEEKEPVLRAFVSGSVCPQRLYRDAESLIEKYPLPELRPPLFGVLIGVKDIFNVEGFPTRAGSRLPPEVFKGPEATIVHDLKQAGALILGKTVSTEFAYFEPGPTTNPLNPKHTPGGSSSGSAAAVGAGLCPLALGTQTIASIIRPASYCAITGFKPSFKRISQEGVFPFSPSADHVGVFAKNVSDMEYICSNIMKEWIHTPPQDKKSLCLGVPADQYLEQAEQETLDFFWQHINDLKKCGCTVKKMSLFNTIEEINNLHYVLIAAEFAAHHEELYKRYGSLYSQHSRILYKKGRKIDKTTVKMARNRQSFLRNEIAKQMQDKGIDLCITPSATSPPPEGLGSTGSPLMSLPWTFAGVPALTIPAGKASNGLPLGIQLSTAFRKDEQLIGMAKIIEPFLKSSDN